MANLEPFADLTLRRLRAALEEIYGARLDRVVLFGSRARGEADAESDHDVAVFLHDMTDRAQEMNHLTDLATNILYNDSGLVHAMPYRAGSYDERTPLMHEIRADGMDP